LEEARYNIQYEKDFAEMKKNNPGLSDQEIDEKIDKKYFFDNEEEVEDSTTKEESIVEKISELTK
jgi:hypothetical protein